VVVVGTSPISLESGGEFPPTPGSVERLKNWPANPAFEEVDVWPDTLLLGGQTEDGSWWYQLAGAGGPTTDGCWPIYGGSFDEGETIRFSSGLRVPKAGSFEIRPTDQQLKQVFPGHASDFVCIDRMGSAVYFELFIGR
jgi:hypothetical protein